MTRLTQYWLCLSITMLMAFSAAAQKPVAREDLKQTQEEYLQSLPEKVRDSIVYKEWKESRSAQEKKETEAAQAQIDAALADPNTTSLNLSYFPGTEVDPRIASLKKLQKLTITKAKKLNLTKLFDLLSKLPELHTLNLSEGSYTLLPANVGNLVSLDSFYFRSNNIKGLPETFSKLKNLRYLDLEHNSYLYDDDLYDKLRQMNVKTLDLSACGLLEINSKIGEVKSLTTLNLSVNDIKVLPASFAQLTSLEALNLSQNTNLNLVAVSASLSHLSGLKTLYLDGCGLASLPAEISSLKSLRLLSVRENVLTTLPASITSLTDLEELYAGSPNNAFRLNVIQGLPVGFGNLKKLRILDLSGNALVSLTSDFVQLTHLEWLDLSRNELPEVPASLYSLTALKFINLNRNKVAVVPDGIGKLTQLDSLFLDGDFFNKADMKIKALPADICSLKNLKKLTLKDNVIAQLPTCIGELSSLTWLDVRGNNLNALPSSFTKLSNLRTLDLKTNDLQSLPADFNNLTSLSDLNIAMNINADFNSIISVLAKMKSLKLLDIGYNNLIRTQAQPLIDALPGCKILNIDYYNKSPLPTNTVPTEGNHPILDNAPKRNPK